MENSEFEKENYSKNVAFHKLRNIRVPTRKNAWTTSTKRYIFWPSYWWQKVTLSIWWKGNCILGSLNYESRFWRLLIIRVIQDSEFFSETSTLKKPGAFGLNHHGRNPTCIDGWRRQMTCYEVNSNNVVFRNVCTTKKSVQGPNLFFYTRIVFSKNITFYWNFDTTAHVRKYGVVWVSIASWTEFICTWDFTNYQYSDAKNRKTHSQWRNQLPIEALVKGLQPFVSEEKRVWSLGWLNFDSIFWNLRTTPFRT